MHCCRWPQQCFMGRPSRRRQFLTRTRGPRCICLRRLPIGQIPAPALRVIRRKVTCKRNVRHVIQPTPSSRPSSNRTAMRASGASPVTPSTAVRNSTLSMALCCPALSVTTIKTGRPIMGRPFQLRMVARLVIRSSMATGNGPGWIRRSWNYGKRRCASNACLPTAKISGAVNNSTRCIFIEFAPSRDYRETKRAS